MSFISAIPALMPGDRVAATHGRENEAEAVWTALEKALADAPAPLSLEERIRPIQDRIKAMMGPNKVEFDEKAFMDEMWEV
jgi:antitoxin VapB